MIKAGIVGISGFGGAHYEDLKRERNAGRVQPVAAVVRTPSKVQDRVEELKSWGCDILPDFETLLAKYAGKLDICCIPTGISAHKPMSIQAVEAGWNVFVEKPVAAVKSDADAMQEASDRTGKFIAVGFQNMYQPETALIKKTLLSGKIGKAKKVRCYAFWPRPRTYYTRNPWAAKLFGSDGEPILDAPFTNALAHDLNLILFYLGESFEGTAEVVKVEGCMLRANPIESCDAASLKFTTRSGQEIIFSIAHSCNCNIDPVTTIECENGSISADRYSENGFIYDAAGNVIEKFDFTRDKSRTYIWDALCGRCNGGKNFICDPKMAGKHTLVTNAVFDSIPITQVPPEFVSIGSFNETDDRRYSIVGIEKAIRTSYDEGRLLNASDLPFVPVNPAFDMTGYKSFENRLYRK